MSYEFSAEILSILEAYPSDPSDELEMEVDPFDLGFSPATIAVFKSWGKAAKPDNWKKQLRDARGRWVEQWSDSLPTDPFGEFDVLPATPPPEDPVANSKTRFTVSPHGDGYAIFDNGEFHSIPESGTWGAAKKIANRLNDEQRTVKMKYQPQLAKDGGTTFHHGPEWMVQRKWDGVRAIFEITEDDTKVFSRTGQDLRPQFPEFNDLHEKYPPGIYDGEILALDENGQDDLERIQLRINDKKARKADEIPVSVKFFDILESDGESTQDQSAEERLATLEAAVGKENTVEVLPADFKVEDIPKSWEGTMSKLRASKYEVGKRRSTWMKYKLKKSATLKVTGLTEGLGSRKASFGAVLVSDANGVPRGQIGSGFTQEDIDTLLRAQETGDWPLIEVEYRFLSKTGLLTNTAYKGIRHDKDEADRFDGTDGGEATPEEGVAVTVTEGKPNPTKATVKDPTAKIRWWREELATATLADDPERIAKAEAKLSGLRKFAIANGFDPQNSAFELRVDRTAPDSTELAVRIEDLILFEGRGDIEVGSYVLTQGGTSGRHRVVKIDLPHAVIVDDPYDWNELPDGSMSDPDSPVKKIKLTPAARSLYANGGSEGEDRSLRDRVRDNATLELTAEEATQLADSLEALAGAVEFDRAGGGVSQAAALRKNAAALRELHGDSTVKKPGPEDPVDDRTEFRDHLDRLESVRDLKVGDRIKVTISGWTGTIVGDKIRHSGWKVRWDNPQFGVAESRVLPSQLEKLEDKPGPEDPTADRIAYAIGKDPSLADSYEELAWRLYDEDEARFPGQWNITAGGSGQELALSEYGAEVLDWLRKNRTAPNTELISRLQNMEGGTFLHMHTGDTFSGWKLHINMGGDAEKEAAAYELLRPLVEEQGMTLKLATDKVQEAWADRAPQQLGKDITVYLPRRAEAQAHTQQIIDAIGSLTYDGDIENDQMLAAGIGLRFEFSSDPEEDIPMSRYHDWYRSAGQSPDLPLPEISSTSPALPDKIAWWENELNEAILADDELFRNEASDEEIRASGVRIKKAQAKLSALRTKLNNQPQAKATAEVINSGYYDDVFYWPPEADEFFSPEQKRALEGHLVFRQGETFTNKEVRRHLEDLALLSEEALNKAFTGGLGVKRIYVGEGGVPSHNDKQDLRGVRPRGWPKGNTWNSVAGCYDEGRKYVVAGVGRHGVASVMLHELAHGIGFATRLHSSAAIRDHQRRLYAKLDPYYRQGGLGGEAGLQELFAEGYGRAAVDRAGAVEEFDEEFVAWVEKVGKLTPIEQEAGVPTPIEQEAGVPLSMTVTDAKGTALARGDRVRSEATGVLGTVVKVVNVVRIDWDGGGSTSRAAGSANRQLKNVVKVEGDEAKPIEIPTIAASETVQLKDAITEKGSRVAKGVAEGIANIEKVHSMPSSMPRQLSVREIGFSDSNDQGQYLHTTSYATQILINERDTNSEITMLHEMGHYLDHQGLSSTRGLWASGGRARKVVEAAYKSEAFLRLKPYWSGRDPEYYEYLAEDKEVFARAYTQWIILRSKGWQKISRTGHWTSPEDFRPIAEALDEMFAEKGLLNAAS